MTNLFFLALLIIAIIFVCGGLVLLFIMTQRRKKLGVLNGKRIYQDTEEIPGKVFYSKSLPLYGKPDYLIEEKEGIIPVEVKTEKTPQAPYANHVMQLIAYCMLVEENYNKRPTHGVIKYPNAQFTVKYTLEYETALRSTVTDMIRLKNQSESLTFNRLSKNICMNCRNEVGVPVDVYSN